MQKLNSREAFDKLGDQAVVCLYAMTVKDLLPPGKWDASGKDVSLAPSQKFAPYTDPSSNPYIKEMLKSFGLRTRGTAFSNKGLQSIVPQLIDALLKADSLQEADLRNMKPATRRQHIHEIGNLFRTKLLQHRKDEEGHLDGAVVLFARLINRQFLDKRA